MKIRRKPWTFLATRWAPLLAGGLALQFNVTGCDPEVRDAVLNGTQTAMTGMLTSIINAFFLSLQGAGTTSQPVVQAVFDAAKSLVA